MATSGGRTTRRWRWRVLVAGALIATALGTAPPADAHTPHDDIFDVAVSPRFAADKTVITISRGILLRSTDGGASFQRLVKGLDNRDPMISVAFAGYGGTRLYAISDDAVFRSDDAGWSWVRVNSGSGYRVLATSSASGEVAIVMTTTSATVTETHGNTWRSLGTPPGTSAAFAPGSSQIAFVGDGRGTLYATRNLGASWSAHDLGPVGAVNALAASPQFATDGDVLVGTSTGGLRRWNDVTHSATGPAAGVTDARVTSVAYSARYFFDKTILVSTWTAGVFRSQDRGTTFQLSSSGLTKDDQATSLARPNFGQLRAAIVDPTTSTQVVLVATFDGLHATRNLATNWARVETLYANIDVGLAVSPTFAFDHTLAVSTYINGAFVSHDGGATWSASNAGLEQPPIYDTGPDRFARLYNIHFSPGTTGQLFTASTAGLLRSSDKGATWQTTTIAGFSDGTSNADSTHFPYVLVSPTYARDHTVLLADGGTGAVYRSTDAGVSFAPVHALPAPDRCFQPSPTFATDHRVYACAAGGIYVSTNFGTSWTATTRLPFPVEALAVSVTAGRQTWFGATTRGLYRSIDLGSSWSRVTLPKPAGDTQVAAVAVSPPGTSAAIVLVTIRGLGLFRSIDGGATFARAATTLLDANEQFEPFNFKATAAPIVLSPAFNTDHTGYAFSFTHVFKTTDAGATWQQLPTPYTTHP